MPEPDRAATDAALEEAARDEGLLHPDWLPRLVDRAAIRYNGEGVPTNVRELAREFRRDFPDQLDVTGSGIPRGMDDRQVHGVPAGRAPRGHAPNGQFEPAQHPMSVALRALANPDSADDPNVDRLVRLTASPAPPKPGPTPEALREATEQALSDARGSDSYGGALGQMNQNRNDRTRTR